MEILLDFLLNPVKVADGGYFCVCVCEKKVLLTSFPFNLGIWIELQELCSYIFPKYYNKDCL